MPALLSQDLATVRAALLGLTPERDDGFEGLLGDLLSRATGVTFRRATSGQQGGVDGDSDPEAHSIGFEAKLYADTVPRAEVLNKITSLIAKAHPPDLWILGSTSTVSAQVAADLRAAAEKAGIAVELLDWPSNNAVSPLAALCAMHPAETAQFLAAHGGADAIAIRAALDRIAADPTFDDAQSDLVRRFGEASLGLALARPRNRAWLEHHLADRRRAKAAFGTILAPRAAGAIPTRPRLAIQQALHTALANGAEGKMFAMLGTEGTGKSWAMAQASMASAHEPVVLILPSGMVAAQAVEGDVETLLIDGIARQTGDPSIERVRQRWRARFARWRRGPKPKAPRLVVCVDGLNEKPDFAWPAWLDEVAVWLEPLGGLLVTSCRKGYFDNRVASGLITEVVEIPVPEWSAAELETILGELQIDISDADAVVRERLRNPRLLAIGVGLLRAGLLRSLAELSIERLLFEHIRLGEREGHAGEPADDFVRRLAEHAGEILQRVNAQQRDDRDIFQVARGPATSHTLNDELLAVSAERYFHRLAEDRSLYQLTDEGLTLALGLALIRELQWAERNHHDLAETLAERVDPIAALDKTADALWAAVVLAAEDSQCTPAVRKALIVALLRMQNLGGQYSAPFVAAIRMMVEPGMQALRDLAASGDQVPHQDWLVAALGGARADPAAWAAMAGHLQSWLSTYSRSPHLANGLYRSDPAQYQARVDKRQAVLEERWATLSTAEASLFGAMTLDDEADVDQLRKVATALMAGKPLEPFAGVLVASALSQAFNSDGSSNLQSRALLRFNRQDWPATRDAVLRAAEPLGGDGVKETGRWALIELLRGLATPDDARRERPIYEELTGDRVTHRGGNIVERWCSTDPCDPASDMPTNVVQTAQEYRALDFTLPEADPARPSMHFVDGALAGVARFVPDAALEAHRNKARVELQGHGEALMQALLYIGELPGALDGPLVDRLIEIAKTFSGPRKDFVPADGDPWIIAQRALTGAFPHLDGEMQAKVLLDIPLHGPPLLDLFLVIKPASADALERLMESAVQSKDVNRKLSALAFGIYSGSPASDRTKEMVAGLTRSPSFAVRSLAFDSITRWNGEALIRAVVESGWSAADHATREEAFEAHGGSRLLLRAFELGLLEEADLLERITVGLYGAAAQRIGQDAKRAIADRVGVALAKAMNFEAPLDPPHVRRLDTSDTTYPAYYRLEHTAKSNADDPFAGLTEPRDAFYKRQKAAWERFKDVTDALTAQGADLVLDGVSVSALTACIAASPAWGDEVADLLMAAPTGRRSLVRNFGLQFGRALAETQPDRADALLNTIVQTPVSFASVSYGLAEIPLETLCVWDGPDHPVLDARRLARLGRAGHDADIAVEVLAALRSGKQALLESYVQTRLACREPAEKGRALMVLGFGEESPDAVTILGAYSQEPGWLGAIAEAAKGAYDRNVWARNWYERLQAAATPSEHWALTPMFLKIVDGRFELWSSEYPARTETAQAFGPGLRNDIGGRIKAWKKKREATLLADHVPAALFIEG